MKLYFTLNKITLVQAQMSQLQRAKSLHIRGLFFRRGMSYDTVSHPSRDGNNPILLRIHIPDEEFLWLSANVVAERGEYFDERTATNTKKVTLEVTDPAYLDKYGAEQRFREINLDYGSLTLQNTDKDMPRDGVNDMAALNYLHEASILENLRRRFQARMPYTYSGGICIALNPYMWLDIYTPELQSLYESKLRHEVDPHVYSTSAHAYRTLRDYNRNQSVLVSGESGAGKTETVKILMKHVAHISARAKGTGKADTSIIEKVLQSNSLLETFGNAKTLRNDNSSRFGKFIHMHMDSMCQLSGSRCTTYLLEKSRVATQNPGERNYHIFHAVISCRGAIRSKVHLHGAKPSDFRYLCGGDITIASIEGLLDEDRFDLTMSTLELLGVEEGTRENLVKVVAGILYLGQTSFVEDDDGSQIVPTESVQFTCDLLGFDYEVFREMITHRTIIEPGTGESVSIPLGRSAAETARDALARDCYERLFFWLVNKVNTSTHSPCSTASADTLQRTIALLDIFGFENFEVNHFEQLCINFANEKLQQKFTNDVFSVIQQEYINEGLEWDKIEYVDNADVLMLFEDRVGILSLLVEECRRSITDPNGLDKSYLNKVVKAFDKKQPKFFKTMKMGPSDFGVVHYAGKVVYNVEGIVQKNKDTMPLETLAFMQSSTNQLVGTIFYEGNDDSRGQRGENEIREAGGIGVRAQASRRRNSFMLAETVLQKFQRQLESLITTIGETDVQYVRCVKPNDITSNTHFDRFMVVEQLRCAGMIEAIRISRAAYPYCVPHNDFVERFGYFSSTHRTREASLTNSRTCTQTGDVTESCLAVLRAVLPEEMLRASQKGMTNKYYEVGHTKVYFSSPVLSRLEGHRYNLVTCVVKLQSLGRGWLCRVAYRRARRRILLAQGAIRRRIATKKVRNRRLATRTIINFTISRHRRRIFLARREAANTIASLIRMFLSKRRYATLLIEKMKHQETSKSLEAEKTRLGEGTAAGALAEAERQTLLRELQALRNENEQLRERVVSDNKRIVTKEGHEEKNIEVLGTQSTSIDKIDSAVQADVNRLQRALEYALNSNKELVNNLNKEKQDSENQLRQQKCRHIEESEIWKEEKAELVRTFHKTSLLLDEIQASEQHNKEELRIAKEKIGQLIFQKEEAEEKYVLERYARKRAQAEIIEMLVSRGVDQAMFVDLNCASPWESARNRDPLLGKSNAFDKYHDYTHVQENTPRLSVSPGVIASPESTHLRLSTRSKRSSTSDADVRLSGHTSGEVQVDIKPTKDDSRGIANSRKFSISASSTSSFAANTTVANAGQVDSIEVGTIAFAVREKELRSKKRRLRRARLRKRREALEVLAVDDCFDVGGDERDGYGEKSILSQIEKVKAEHLKQIEKDAAAAVERTVTEAQKLRVERMRKESEKVEISTAHGEETRDVSSSDEGSVEGLSGPNGLDMRSRDLYSDEDGQAGSVGFGGHGSGDEEVVSHTNLQVLPRDNQNNARGVFGVGFFGL